MGEIEMRPLVLGLLVICAAWHGSVDGLPVEIEASDVALLDEEAAPKNPMEKHTEKVNTEAKLKAKETERETKALRHQIKYGVHPSTTSASLSNKGTTATAAKVPVMNPTATGSLIPNAQAAANNLRVSKITKAVKAKEKPEGSKYDGQVKVGDKGWLEDQIKKATGQMTTNTKHHKYSIHDLLESDEDAKWDNARRKARLVAATEQASQAAANMANAVRAEEAQSVDRCKKREAKMAQKIARARSGNGIPCPNAMEAQSSPKRLLLDDCPSKAATKHQRIAKLMLRWARVKGKCAKLLAKAKGMGKAVNTMIKKAARVQGNAEASAKMADEGTSELQRAILAHAKAKMALELFRKQHNYVKQAKRDDKALHKEAEKTAAKFAAQKEKLKDEARKEEAAAKEKDRQEALAQETAFKNTPAKGSKDFKIRPLKRIRSATRTPAPKTTATAKSTPTAESTPTAHSHASLTTQVQHAVQQAHSDGTKRSADKAKELVKQLKNTPKPKPK